MSEAKFSKGHNGWSGETKIDLGITKQHDKVEWPMFMSIDTSKDSRGNLYTRASVNCVRGNQIMFAFSDFSKLIERDVSGTRCTEKAVRVMHARNTADVTALIEEAKVFYANKRDAA